MPPCYVSLKKLPNLTTPINLMMMPNTWERVSWCGETWWNYSSELENYARSHPSIQLQHIEVKRPELYRWLVRMRASLVDAKNNQRARQLHPDDFEGTVLTNQHINIMVGWINCSLEKMKLPKLQNLPLYNKVTG